MGVDPGEVYSPGAGAGRRPLNTANFRFGADELARVGVGSLRQKARDNFAAIELSQLLEREARPASEEEKRVLVRYVGWGGIPQVFASWQEPGASDWREERAAIERLLTPEQYEAARASTLNAHYTAPGVVSAMYEAVERLGFTGGRVLEPAVGVGHFFGLMPEAMHARSRLTGIELDPVTAAIASKLYPDANLRCQGFENAALVDGSFDLAISNVPFGDYRPVDAQLAERRFLIHDYFFAKSVEKVRPGGLVAFITSKGTMDKLNSSLRAYLGERADFLGAIRLPNTAFKQNANTEVTTDIVFLRRRLPGERPQGPAWLDLATHTNPDGVDFQVNEYYAANPHMMLGVMRNAGTMYRANEPTLAPDGRELAEALRGAVARLPQGVIRPEPPAAKSAAVSTDQDVQILAPGHVKENAFTTLEDGRIAIRTGATLTPVAKLSDESARRIRGLIRLRDAVRETLRTQLEGAGESEVLLARRQLNERYDQFTSRFGPVNEARNSKAFNGDPDLPLILSLENFDEETKAATKTAIFTERTIHQTQAPRSAENARDALVLSLNATGRVDLEHMEELLGRPTESFLPELKGLVYRNPQTEQWEAEDQYLSGDVRAKLAAAQTAAESDPSYRENTVALEAVQPEDLSASEIDARLGAVWIPSRDIEEFAAAIVPDGGTITVSHAPQVGAWFVEAGYEARSSVANTTDWGTARYRALDLIQDALNLKTPTVYDKDPLDGEANCQRAGNRSCP